MSSKSRNRGDKTSVIKKKIVVIFHERDRRHTQNYSITSLAEEWRESGIETSFVFGTKHFIPADLAILHVNLSVVPDEYIEFAQNYPVVLNGRVKDIRKSAFSTNIVCPEDGYEGKIIVKSNLNYAGGPERRLQNSVVKGLLRHLRRGATDGAVPARLDFNSAEDYFILESVRQVPGDWFEREDIVIEKFLPERENGNFLTRSLYFLGDSNQCVLWKSPDPIVKRSTATGMELVGVHAEIVAMRKKLQFDYGKFDYIVNENDPVLIDINKTIGASPDLKSFESELYPLMRHKWASGIYSFFS